MIKKGLHMSHGASTGVVQKDAVPMIAFRTLIRKDEANAVRARRWLEDDIRFLVGCTNRSQLWSPSERVLLACK